MINLINMFKLTNLINKILPISNIKLINLAIILSSSSLVFYWLKYLQKTNIICQLS